MSGCSPTKTTCPYCGVGCGVLAARDAEGTVAIKGDPDHRANFGRLCSKGSALGETLNLEGRVLRPRVAGRETSWDDALTRLADGFGETVARHGPDSIALYVSGQLLTEDYYVANKFLKGFVGTANIDTNSRLCMASSVAGHKRAFGSDTVPGSYEDLEEADLVVLVGSNLAWCHPVLFQRLMAARDTRGTRVIAVDPRATATTEIAEDHLAIAPGSDVALFNGLLGYLADHQADASEFIEAHTEGLEDALAVARKEGLRGAASATGLDPLRLTRFYETFRTTERVVTVYSQGVNQSTAGTDKVNAILNCHLLTGRIGRAGMGPFSVTGQPNAMGGREVGGLSNQLAAHMDFADPAHRAAVADFWKAPRLATRPGYKAVDLFRAVERGDVKAVWIMATNPATSLPEADRVAAALKACPLVAVSDVVDTTRTAQLADILLPAAAWGEKDGTVTNSERCISRQRPFLPSPGEAKPDWWMVCEVAKRMGFSGFEFGGPADIFREHAALSAYRNGGTRDFDIGALAEMDDSAYDALAPVQWPVPKARPGGTKRLFASGGFFREGGRAALVPTPYRTPAVAPTTEFPLVLNTGRVRDQWHTMTRTGKSARLLAHIAEPFVEIHPDDAAAAGIAAADLACVESARGRILARALVTDRQARGSLFVPMHWTEPYASCAQVDALVDGHVDPVSGQPELKFTPVRLSRHRARWHGFLVATDRPDLSEFPYWALAPTRAGWRAELAGDIRPTAFETLARRLLCGAEAPGASLLSYADKSGAAYRFAYFRGDRLEGALIVSPKPVDAARAWLANRLGERIPPEARLRVLAGRAGADRPDPGPIVCACFEVGAHDIARAVETGARSADAVGQMVKAGTNCGSCRAEVQRIVEAYRVPAAV